MTRRSWVTWRVVVAAAVLWLADLAWDLYDWLARAAYRIQRPARPAARGVVRLAVLSVLSGVGLVAGGAMGLRGTVERPGVEARPAPAPREASADIAEGIARGCASAGRDVVAGVQDGVWVLRCRAPVENLGVMPPPPASRFPAKVRARAPEERGSAGSIRDDQVRAGASAGRAGTGIDATGGIQ